MNDLINRLIADNKGVGFFRAESLAENELTLYVYDVIVSDASFGGVSALEFNKVLASSDASVVHIRINSPGGEIFSAQAMVAAVREKKATCIAHIDGLAASAASWLALAADEVVISPGGMVMIHNAQGISCGTAADHRSSADLLDKIDQQLVEAYAKSTGKDAETISGWMANETWFSAAEAVEYGFASRMATDEPVNAVVARWNVAAYDSISNLRADKEERNAPVVDLTDGLRRSLRLVEHLDF